MKAEDTLARARDLISGDRNDTHGERGKSFQTIAFLWNVYLQARPSPHLPLTPHEVGMLLALLKVSRSLTGAHNPDNFLDGAAYFALAGELAEACQDEKPKQSDYDIITEILNGSKKDDEPEDDYLDVRTGLVTRRVRT